AEVMYDLQNYKELDRGYKKTAKISIALFVAVVVLFITFLSSAVSFKVKANTIQKENYKHFITEATSAPDDLTAVDMYTKAILMEPENKQAYMDLLNNLFLVDENLTEAEAQQLRTILITPTKDGTVEECLARNKEAYAEFSYKLGVAYFYCYEGVGNKHFSNKWFNIAASSGTLSNAQKERAERLGKIAGYYDTMDYQSGSGDLKVDPREYWDDLVSAADGDIAAVDNETTALIIYKEVGIQIFNRADKFLKSGVSYDEMSNEINYILKNIDQIVNNYELTDRTRDLVNANQRQFAQAKTALDTAAGK
ncbi:MAG: hypothetical protein VZR06_01430, partial [Butyrivibrio sp.]|nr:hypothetical protein [Butyrivibrio sp.]